MLQQLRLGLRQQRCVAVFCDCLYSLSRDFMRLCVWQRPFL